MTRAYRLPSHVRPTRYEIHLDAEVGRPAFEGRVTIALDVQKATDRVEVHARELDIRATRLLAAGWTEAGTAKPDPDAEMVALSFPRAAPVGEATLEIDFAGTVSQGMHGLYLSKDGAEECLATQCEETHARAIFPCFDEPAFKARFALTVTTAPEVTVLGNAPLVEAREHNGRKTWRFDDTKPMSSYLFATAIGRFGHTEERVVRGVPMRVYAPAGKERFGDFGLDLAARLLPWFEDYFGAKYHFDKYDQIAVPSFSAGAMENSGLIVFRQSLLLRDPATTSWQAEKMIAHVIAHEFAHQWFGNLVTMDWWDDIWLNESFAEWMSYKATDVMRPDYQLWGDFYANKRDAFVPDALETTHPIYTPVETPEQASELFDAVTYSKGSVLMRMIERYLGEDAFRAGLRTYMREFAESNAKGADLWRHLAVASKQPVERLAESWILQPGYPLVSVRTANGALHLSQTRYFTRPDASPTQQVWAVPLVVRYADDEGVHELRRLFDARETTLALATKGELRWAHVNADGAGFFRQDLSPDLLSRLVAHMGELTAPEQRDLLDDAWALVRRGTRPISSYLDLLGAIAKAPADHHVLSDVAAGLQEIEELVGESGDADAMPKLRRWAGALLEGEAARLDLEPRAGDTRDDAERRALTLGILARLARDPAAQRAAVALADREAADPTSVDPTIAGVAVGLAARGGDAARHAKHVAIYEERRAAGAPPNLSQRYLMSLCVFEDEALLAKTLDMIDEGEFPLEAVGPMLRVMLDERHSRVPAWSYMKGHWKEVRERLGELWVGFLVEHSGNLPGRLRDEMVEFYDANLGGSAQQSFARAVEAMDARIEFERRVTPDLVKWLRAR